MQFMKQRLAVIKSVMDESDFQLQTKIKTNKQLDLAYKNTAEDDLADEEESEEDEFTQQINKMLELKELDSAQKKPLNSPVRMRERDASVKLSDRRGSV